MKKLLSFILIILVSFIASNSFAGEVDKAQTNASDLISSIEGHANLASSNPDNWTVIARRGGPPPRRGGRPGPPPPPRNSAPAPAPAPVAPPEGYEEAPGSTPQQPIYITIPPPPAPTQIAPAPTPPPRSTEPSPRINSSDYMNYIKISDAEANNDKAEDYYKKGNASYKKQEYERAVQYYKSAVKYNSKHYKAYYNCGVTHKKLRQYSEAIEDFTKALEINPEYKKAYTNRQKVRAIVAGKPIPKTRTASSASAKISPIFSDNKTDPTMKVDKKSKTPSMSNMASTKAKSKITVKKSKSGDLWVAKSASTKPNPDAIAVVIGNKSYKKAKDVKFAVNDAAMVKKYLMNVFGYKDGNIFYIENASQSDFSIMFGNKDNPQGKLFNAVKEGKSDVFIYYSGHGAPGLKDKRGYFVPVEADPQYIELSGYPADVFYENISKIPARSLTVVLDTCFSGATVFENISPMVVKIDNPVEKLNGGVVLSSSQGQQVSSWYNEKEHGMFTYFFLKAIKNKNADADADGQLSFQEIYSYIADKTEGVPYYARRIHGVDQMPGIEGDYKGRSLLK